jgi:hypothetical protein
MGFMQAKQFILSKIRNNNVYYTLNVLFNKSVNLL